MSCVFFPMLGYWFSHESTFEIPLGESLKRMTRSFVSRRQNIGVSRQMYISVPVSVACSWMQSHLRTGAKGLKLCYYKLHVCHIDENKVVGPL